MMHGSKRMGLAIILLVTVFVPGCQCQPELNVEPPELDFGSTSTQKSIEITNTGSEGWGSDDLEYDLEVDSSWLALSSSGGTCPHDAEDRITVTVDRTAMSDGPAEGQVSVVSNGGHATVDVFANKPPSATVTVTSPASGVTWTEGESRTIQWTHTGSCSNVKIQLYKGSSLKCTIVSSTANDGSYTWSPVDNCGGGVGSDYRVKITCTTDSSCTDYSGYFTIQQGCSITATSPASGVTWTEGESRTIQWTHTGSCSNVKIELYKGSTYLCPIVSSTANDGSYTWSPVDNCGGGVGSDYRVKITCTTDSSCTDYSGYFTIQQGCSITATSPASGVTWTEGEGRTIQWTHTGSCSNVKIELYKGSTYLCPIVSSTANDNSYTWSPVDNCGGGAGSDYRVKVTCTTDSSCTDYSDYFTINAEPCSITVTSPASGVTWTEGESRTIQWTHTGSCSNVKIELYKGSTYLCPIVSSTANDNSYTWSPVDNCGGGAGSDYRVKVTCTTDSSCTDYSGYFTIQQGCSITATSPASGVTWTEGEGRTIQWTHTGSCSNVKIELYKGSTYLCPIVSSTANDNSYTWSPVDNCGGGAGSDYRVKVTCTTDSSCTDYSGYFTINAEPCSITVTSPASGTSWYYGNTRTITWNHTGDCPSVRIDLYNHDVYKCTIVSSTANDGSYNWTVDDCGCGTSSFYQIRVFCTSDATCSDLSDNFNLYNWDCIGVTSPGSGDSWQIGDTESITWTSTDGSGNVKIELFLGTSNYLCTIASSTANDGNFSWTVDDCAHGTDSDYRIKISRVGEASCNDFSEEFTIEAEPEIVVTDAMFYLRILEDEGRSMGVSKLLGTWQEGSVTWNTQPSWDNSVLDLGTRVPSGGSTWLRFDLPTSLVEDWISQPASNYGLSIWDTITSSHSYDTQIRFNDRTADSEYRPYLEIFWHYDGDPTGYYTDVPVAMDQFISDYFPNSNFGSASLFAGWKSSNGENRRTLLRFDVAAWMP